MLHEDWGVVRRETSGQVFLERVSHCGLRIISRKFVVVGFLQVLDQGCELVLERALDQNGLGPLTEVTFFGWMLKDSVIFRIMGV